MNVNESSLFAELTEQDINDVDEGADILGESWMFSLTLSVFMNDTFIY